jgi:deoxyribodipyrimidine photolyase-related protein
MTILIPILGDQLSASLAALTAADRRDSVILMMEVADEATYVRHHQKKIAFLFAAMRHFADDLRVDGWTVDYVTLDDPANCQSFDVEIVRAADRHGATGIITVEAGEWRVLAMQKGWGALTSLPCTILPDDRFFDTRADFADWAAPRKRLVMEDYYRLLRRRTGLLLRVCRRWNAWRISSCIGCRSSAITRMRWWRGRTICSTASYRR